MLKLYYLKSLAFLLILTSFVHADEIAPVVSNLQVKYVSNTIAMVSWETDESSNSIIQYGTSTSTWGNYPATKTDEDLMSSHNLIIDSLQPSTSCYIRVGSTDINGNGPSINPNSSNPSVEMAFITTDGPDVEAPQISNVSVTSVTGNSAVIEWLTDEPADTQVEYDLDSNSWGSYAFNYNDTKMITGHTITITGLSQNTLYYFRVSSTDLVGNNHATSTSDLNPSIEYNFLTNDLIIPPNPPEIEKPLDEVVIPYGSPVLLQASNYYDPDGDNHVESIWDVKRSDTGQPVNAEYPFSDTGLSSHTMLTPLDEGLKYDWQVAYVDTDGIPSWSEEYSFKVGTPETDILPPVEAGKKLGDFSMISIVNWPNNPDPEAIFNINYDPLNYRIGAYDPEQGHYIEFGKGLTMEPGRAFWILTREPLVVNIKGVPVSKEHDIEVCLHTHSDTGTGWNMIAPPNASNYLWNNVLVGRWLGENDPLNVDPVAVSHPVADTLINHRILEWKNGEYVNHKLDEYFVLEYYKGYWVKAIVEGAYLVFPVSAQVSDLSSPGNTMLAWKRKAVQWLKAMTPQTREAIADNNMPPVPMDMFSDNVDPVFNGCFLTSMDNL